MDRRKVNAIIGAAAVSLLLGGVCFGRYSGGTGEPNDPYRIGTAADLNDIANHVEDYNKCFVLTADINMSGFSFGTAVIASDTDPYRREFQGTTFTGVFDGNDHALSNLTVDAFGFDYIGLFGYLGS
ncbi:MAG: hypothetical protein ACYS29_09335, partial [Planctomycetota bacterium]